MCQHVRKCDIWRVNCVPHRCWLHMRRAAQWLHGAQDAQRCRRGPHVASTRMQALAQSKQQLFALLEPLEQRAGTHEYLAGSSLSVADVAAMVDLRPAFEKVRCSAQPSLHMLLSAKCAAALMQCMQCTEFAAKEALRPHAWHLRSARTAAPCQPQQAARSANSSCATCPPF